MRVADKQQQKKNAAMMCTLNSRQIHVAADLEIRVFIVVVLLSAAS